MIGNFPVKGIAYSHEIAQDLLGVTFLQQGAAPVAPPCTSL